MLNILIWGIGTDYDNVMCHLQKNIVNNEVRVLALISSSRESYTFLDGIKVIQPQCISDFNYDYIIIASEKHFETIRKTAISIGVSSSVLIRGKIVCNNLFDFNLYSNILKSNVSIISDDCWGGWTYHSLGLQFISPFINCFPTHEHFIKLISNLKYYLNQPLIMQNEGSISMYPVGCIGDVQLNFSHFTSFNEAYECYMRRLKRINYNNILIKMTIQNDEEAELFSQLPYENKAGFYYKETGLKDIVCLKEWQNEKVRVQHANNFRNYVLSQSYNVNVGGSKDYNIFKLLNGEKDFLRKI